MNTVVVMLQLEVFDVQRRIASSRRASIEKARKILDYEPRTEMRIGLSRVFEWFKENWENIQKSASF